MHLVFADLNVLRQALREPGWANFVLDETPPQRPPELNPAGQALAQLDPDAWGRCTAEAPVAVLRPGRLPQWESRPPEAGLWPCRAADRPGWLLAWDPHAGVGGRMLQRHLGSAGLDLWAVYLRKKLRLADYLSDYALTGTQEVPGTDVPSVTSQVTVRCTGEGELPLARITLAGLPFRPRWRCRLRRQPAGAGQGTGAEGGSDRLRPELARLEKLLDEEPLLEVIR